MTKEKINDILHFLRKGNSKALQQAQLLLNAEVEKQYWKEINTGNTLIRQFGDKKVYYVDVGNMPPDRAIEIVHQLQEEQN